jgi:hypothetical protein
MTRLALLSLLLLVSAACGGNRASGGPADSVTLRSSAPILVVENTTGYDYEIFVYTFGGLPPGRLLGTVRALRNTPLPLVDIPSNGNVRFRARPMGTTTANPGTPCSTLNLALNLDSGRMEFAGQRQLTWRLGGRECRLPADNPPVRDNAPASPEPDAPASPEPVEEE